MRISIFIKVKINSCRLTSELIDYVVHERYNLFEVANCDLK